MDPSGLAFDLSEAIGILERTPGVLRALLNGLPDAWLAHRASDGGWNVADVVAHLIHGEHTDWLPRARRILASGTEVPFEPFDPSGFAADRGRPIGDLLAELQRLRARNLEELRGMALSARDLDRHGRHPSLGGVTLRQLLATWTAHDLNHLDQVCRVLASRYRREVGPWDHPDYLGILHRRKAAPP